MINKLFKDLINSSNVVVYLNNILIFTEILKQHYTIFMKVLNILKKNDLFTKPEKYLLLNIIQKTRLFCTI